MPYNQDGHIMFITQQGLLKVFRRGYCRMDTPNKVAIHDRTHKITQKTDLLCNKHNVSNLILRYPVTTILSRFVALVCSVKQTHTNVSNSELRWKPGED